jgi:hypothetical protein
VATKKYSRGHKHFQNDNSGRTSTKRAISVININQTSQPKHFTAKKPCIHPLNTFLILGLQNLVRLLILGQSIHQDKD